MIKNPDKSNNIQIKTHINKKKDNEIGTSYQNKVKYGL